MGINNHTLGARMGENRGIKVLGCPTQRDFCRKISGYRLGVLVSVGCPVLYKYVLHVFLCVGGCRVVAQTGDESKEIERVLRLNGFSVRYKCRRKNSINISNTKIH